MGRAIYADALKLDIVEEGQKSKRYKLGEFWELNRDEIWNVIDRQPTIERKTGRWIRIYSRPNVLRYLGWTCSECGVGTGEEYAPQWFKYCPNCGAQMEKGEQE